MLNVEKLETLEKLGIKFSNISGILHKTRVKACEELLKVIDANKETLEILETSGIKFLISPVY